MHTAEIDTLSLNNEIKTSSFSSNLKNEIESRASNRVDTAEKTSGFFYTVGSYNILVEQDIKVENISGLTINKVPHTPEWCTGIVNIRGNIMPIVNMHTFLKTGIDASSKKSKLIMLEYKNLAPIIFQIDKLPEMVFIDDYTSKQVSGKSPEWLIESLKNGTNTLYKVDHHKLFTQLTNTQL